MKPGICIFTPTYNRAYKLPDLYKSLLSQTSRDFCWMIVDDGSTDETSRVVNSWKENADFEITYIKQGNGGKQRAINTGSQACRTELFCCVDSDDTLIPDAVEIILSNWKTYSDNHIVAGIVTPRAMRNDLFPESGAYKLGEINNELGYRGETLIATRTEIVRQHPFWVDPEEKFIPELYQFDQIDQKYTYEAIKMELCIGSYLEDGYSRSYGELILNNPRSFAEYKRQCILFSRSALLRLKETLLYLGWSYIGMVEKEVVIQRAPNQLLCKSLYPLSPLISKVIYISIEKSNA